MTTSPESKWTPGPWSVTDADDRREHPAIMSENDCLAHVWHNDLSRKRVVANAHLMAAAPDIAEAARPLAALVEAYTGSDAAMITVTAGELRALAAALSKAEGR